LAFLNYGQLLHYRQFQEKLCMTKLHGKTVLATGASSGIGEVTALALAAEGAVIALSGRRTDRLEALAKRIAGSGGRAKAITADVSFEDQAREIVLAASAEFARLDILVNNAGVMLLGPIENADTKDWRRMVGTNVMGLMYATHAALPLMRAQGSGHIVNISSVAGRTARAGVYNAGKWGVGAVATELTQHITNAEVRKQTEEFYGNMTPLESEDIAAAIVYAVIQPPRVNVNEILIRPTDQER